MPICAISVDASANCPIAHTHRHLPHTYDTHTNLCNCHGSGGKLPNSNNSTGNNRHVIGTVFKRDMQQGQPANGQF